MNIKADHHRTVSAFLNLRDVWLLDTSNTILVIREVQYTHTKPEPEPEDQPPLPPNTKLFKRKQKKAEERAKALEEYRVTELKIEGYHPDGRFIGTFNDEFCERLIRMQDDKYSTFNIYQYRKRWEELMTQRDAFLEHEVELEKRAKETKPEKEEADK